MKVIFFANTDWYLYNFRLRLILAVRSLGVDVIIVDHHRSTESAATGANGYNRSDRCAAEARDADPVCSVLSVKPDGFDAVSWGRRQLDARIAAG